MEDRFQKVLGYEDHKILQELLLQIDLNGTERLSWQIWEPQSKQGEDFALGNLPVSASACGKT